MIFFRSVVILMIAAYVSTILLLSIVISELISISEIVFIVFLAPIYSSSNSFLS